MKTDTRVHNLLNEIADVEWKRIGQTGNPPEITTDKLREWMPPFQNVELTKRIFMLNHFTELNVILPKQIPKEPEPDDWQLRMWHRIRRCKIQHAMDVPIQICGDRKREDYPKVFNSENKQATILIPDEDIENIDEIKPRITVDIAMMGILCGLKNEDYSNDKIQKGCELSSFEDSISAIHTLWLTVHKVHEGEFKHPLEPLLNQYLQETAITKKISREYDRTHPAAILKNPLGSIQDINFNGPETARLREFATPESIQPMQESLFETQSLLPNVLPLGIAAPLGVNPTTKSGAVPHVLRIFFEALMALEPSEMKMDISFTLGDLIHYLYPDGKFNRTNQLPHIINALEILHTYATVPFRQENGDIGRWRPVVVRNVIGNFSKNDTRILLDVRLPDDAQQGMLVQKQIMRMLGKKSAPQFSAYLSACHLWDKYGTQEGKLIDPSRPIENRNSEGYLVDANGNELRGQDGNRIKNLYSPDAVSQLEREPNPSRTNYPILSYDDLIKACNLNEAPNKHMALKRAKDYWTRLEKESIVAIERLREGWRIMPSEKHMKTYRAMIQAIQNSRD